MKNLNLSQVDEPKQYVTVAPGAYIIKIESVKDFPDKEYLKFEYDFAEGQHKGHYFDLFQSKGFWAGNFIKSYKDKALPFFKAFITSLENSNKFTWDGNEDSLRGKLVGAILAEEQYRKQNGDMAFRLYVDQFHSIDRIRKGEFKVPPTKMLAGANQFGTTVQNDEPFVDPFK